MSDLDNAQLVRDLAQRLGRGMLPDDSDTFVKNWRAALDETCLDLGITPLDEVMFAINLKSGGLYHCACLIWSEAVDMGEDAEDGNAVVEFSRNAWINNLYNRILLLQPEANDG